MAYSANGWSNLRPGRRRAESVFLTTSPIASGWLRSTRVVIFSCIPIRANHSASHPSRLASGLPMVAANSGGITSFAGEANAWLAEPTAAAFAAAVRQAFQDHGARLAKVREGLATAFAHRWDCAALAYFSLYDAIHAEFRAMDTLACFPPYAWSTPATDYADAVIAASSALAQTFFRSVVRFGWQSPGSRNSISALRANGAIRNRQGREISSHFAS